MNTPTKNPLFHVVLHEPEIPNNTGNIGRTCIATGCALHLIHPLSFDTNEKALRRAGLDYWPRLNPAEYQSWSDYLAAQTSPKAPTRWYCTTKAPRPAWDAAFKPGDHLIFGKETAGLPDSILGSAHPDNLIALPMLPGERSLNLATAVCAVIYEALRQSCDAAEITLDDQGRIALPEDR
jgi:tRNA (cytidine/uridine-2'-O-)-methyltransferase